MKNKPISIKVYLVHGTWARQARWIRDGSPLRKALQEGLEGKVTFATMPWTGRNRALDRAKASIELKTLLESTTGDSDANFVVAHSHGGNIAVDWVYLDTLAKPHPRSEQRTEDDKQFLLDGVITLNTPFLTVIPRDRVSIYIHYFMATAALSFLVPALLLKTIFTTALVWTGLWFSFGFIAAILLTRFLEGADVFDFSREPRTALLSICMPDDEAFSWLDAMDGLLNLPHLLLHKIALPATLLAVALAHYFWRWNFLIPDWIAVRLMGQRLDLNTVLFGEPPRIPADVLRGLSLWLYEQAPPSAMFPALMLSVFYYFLVFWAALAFGSLIVTYVVRGAAFGDGFGPSTLLRAFIGRLTVSLTPMWLRNVELMVVQSKPGAWLRHSDIYENPFVLTKLVIWMNKRIDLNRRIA